MGLGAADLPFGNERNSGCPTTSGRALRRRSHWFQSGSALHHGAAPKVTSGSSTSKQFITNPGIRHHTLVTVTAATDHGTCDAKKEISTIIVP